MVKRLDEYSFYVEDILAFAEEDTWQEGADPDTSRSWSHDVNEEFDTFDDMFDRLTSNYGLTDDRDSWGVFTGENGRIEVQQMEDDSNFIITPKSRIWDMWKRGERRLWLVNYSIYLKLVKSYSPTDDELLDLTGLQEI